MMGNEVIAAMILMGATGLLLGAVIGICAAVFKAKRNQKLELVLELLPGANCGGCGTAGCADFAKAVVEGKLPPSGCPVSSAEQISSIAKALGIETGSGIRRKAVVLCGGDINQVTRTINYAGVADCVSAAMIAGGPKSCAYGCLGFGSCARKCPFGAIEIVNNLAIVHDSLCVGCGKCADVCPRHVIRMVPAEAKVHIYCNSPEKGALKRKSCKVGCIGCGKCERAFPNSFAKDGNCEKIKYESETIRELTGDSIANAGCPTGALLSADEHLRIERENPEWSNSDE